MADSTILPIRFTAAEVDAIDAMRGQQPRSTWIKALCRGAVSAREAFGAPCNLTVVAQEIPQPEPPPPGMQRARLL